MEETSISRDEVWLVKKKKLKKKSGSNGTSSSPGAHSQLLGKRRRGVMKGRHRMDDTHSLIP